MGRGGNEIQHQGKERRGWEHTTDVITSVPREQGESGHASQVGRQAWPQSPHRLLILDGALQAAAGKLAHDGLICRRREANLGGRHVSWCSPQSSRLCCDERWALGAGPAQLCKSASTAAKHSTAACCRPAPACKRPPVVSNSSTVPSHTTRPSCRKMMRSTAGSTATGRHNHTIQLKRQRGAAWPAVAAQGPRDSARHTPRQAARPAHPDTQPSALLCPAQGHTHPRGGWCCAGG